MVNSKVSSNSDTQSVNKSIFEIPKMDCAAEEQMIRMELADLEGVQHLSFDLNARRLTIRHSGQLGTIANRLIALQLGARLLQTSMEAESAQLEHIAELADGTQSRVLKQLLAINATMFVIEIVVGWLAESTGLIADSLDMSADAAVYGLSLYAVGHAGSLKRRAAHISGWVQLVLALGTLLEVVRRFVFGSEPESPLMIGMGAVALLANVTCLLLLARHREGGAHMKASWIFSTNDVIANAGVIGAGVLVAMTGSRFPDLVVGSIISAIVMNGASRILRLR